VKGLKIVRSESETRTTIILQSEVAKRSVYPWALKVTQVSGSPQAIYSNIKVIGNKARN
jgi:hypothetical protein